MTNLQASPRSEYLPSESEHNGNGHHNGNSRPPAFRLAPVIAPEEEARTEVLREIAPKVRRKVREDSRLSAGAKFFFYALFDDAFWHAVGGHGTGQIFADIRTLSERYHHDAGSIVRWREELEEAGWLWTNYEWPMTEWRLTPLLPAPSFSPHKKAVQMSLGRATKPVGEMHTTPSTNGKSAKNGVSPVARVENGVSPSASCPSPVGEMPIARVHPAVDSVGIMHTGAPQDAHGVPPKSTRAHGKMHTGAPQDAHDRTASRPRPGSNGARPLGRNGSREKSLGGSESGESGGVGDSPPQEKTWERDFRKWEGTLDKKFDRELREILAPLDKERLRLQRLVQQQSAAHGKPGPKTVEALQRVTLKTEAINFRLTGPQ